jgi:hypothetical protein
MPHQLKFRCRVSVREFIGDSILFNYNMLSKYMALLTGQLQKSKPRLQITIASKVLKMLMMVN